MPKRRCSIEVQPSIYKRYPERCCKPALDEEGFCIHHKKAMARGRRFKLWTK